MFKIFFIAFAIGLKLFAVEPTAPTGSVASPGVASSTQKAASETKIVGYTKEFSPTIYKNDECLQKNVFEACQDLVSKKKSDPTAKPTEVFLIAKKACELKGEGCVGIYSIAKSASSDAFEGLQKFLEAQCIKSAEACNELASVFEAQKDYTNAIDYARKYYLKFQKGNFAKFSYLYGDKNEAFAASLSECTKNNSDCVMYIKSMTDHPQIAKLVEFAEADCKKDVSGSSSCLTVGHYYNKNLNFSKAAEVWGLQCNKENAESCIMVIGSKGIEPAKKMTAYSKLCSISGKIPISILNVKKMNCQNSSAIEIPNQLKIFSEYELRKLDRASP